MERSAVLQMPDMSQLGGQPASHGVAHLAANLTAADVQAIQAMYLQMKAMHQAAQQGGAKAEQPPWVRMPFYPTAPFYSTRKNVGYSVRFYGATLIPGQNDYVINTEARRPVLFAAPAVVVAWNGSAFRTGGTALPVGYVPNDLYLFSASGSSGDKLTTEARLASTVLGTGEKPGELGGTGYTVNTGATLDIGLTPLLADIRVDVTLVCLEARGPSNYTEGG